MNLARALGLLLILVMSAGCSSHNMTGGPSAIGYNKSGGATCNPKDLAANPESEAFPDGELLDPELAKGELSPDDYADSLTPQEEQALLAETELHFDLEKHETQEMERFFIYFTHKARPTFERWLERARPYLPYVRQVLQEYNLPEELIVLPFAESGYNNFALSSAGALGMWQFMPATGRRFGLDTGWWLDERRDHRKATKAAAEYLSQLHDMFDDWYLALAAYNAGEGKISWAMGKSGCDNFFDLAKEGNLLKEETRLYVPKFLAILKIFRNLEALGFTPVNWEVAYDAQPLPAPGGTDLLGLAQSAGMSWSEFQALNPAFKRQASPPEKTTTVFLPAARLTAAQAYLANPARRAWAGWREYEVKKGDTWAKLASRLDTPVDVLREVNSAKTLKPGMKIKTPGLASGDEPAASSAKSSALAELKAKTSGKLASYTVEKGDTLYAIAKRLDTSPDKLLAANGIKSAQSLQIGQTLKVPDNVDAITKLDKKAAAKIRERVKQEMTLVEKAEAKVAKGAKDRTLSYKVCEGDTVWSIARKFKVDPKGLLALNNLDQEAVLKPGDSLKVKMP